MNSEKLQNLILEAIERKHISQRELAKLTGISRSTLNDIVNGKIKKIKLDNLYQISIPLELNLEDLLESCGFNQILKTLNLNRDDRLEKMSHRELKDKIKEYQKYELDLLSWDADKRKHCRKAYSQLFYLKERIKISQEYDNKEYTKDQIIDDITKVMEELKPVEIKYDYSKLPGNK